MRPLALLLLLTAACEAPPQTPAPTLAPSAAPTGPFIPDPSRFEREVAVSEEAADAVKAAIPKHFCAGLRDGGVEEIAGALTPDATGRALAPFAAAGAPDLVTIRLATPDPTDLDRDAFARALLRLGTDGVAAVERCWTGVYRFKLAARGRDRAAATALFEVVGTRAVDGARLVRRGEIRFSAVHADGRWRADRVELLPFEEVTAPRPLFADVSSQVGVELGRTRYADDALQAEAEALQLTTIGGVAVADYDGDGDDDLLAWNRMRTLQVFLNDGAGGFQKRSDLVPPAEVGFFQLLVDLDGDGVDELVSSRVVACRDGQAELGLYRRDGERWARVPGALRYASPCAEDRRIYNQSIVPADVDRDGRLDLFVAAYAGPHSRSADHNTFQASDGLPDLLFVQKDGLRFDEEAEARGITGTAFSYAATFLDVDGDADLDLYVANDYGTNDVWVNDGAGRFTRDPTSPLALNGQSMGVTVADLDGDLDLDVYVSNMFSKAGHRIVPLVEGQVGKGTFDALMLVARGNTLFRREGATWREVGVAENVSRAGWAWGQAVFDADNDGDRELFVVNGLTSHRDRRKPDF